MNFETILQECRARYRGFDRKVSMNRTPRSFEEAILGKKSSGANSVITEIKPSSPSGTLREVEDVGKVVKEMVLGGACAISVLTEERYFGGSLANLREAASASSVPVLRKDFIFEESQIYEAYHYGADSLLLISSFFAEEKLAKLLDTARRLGMEPLVEVHSAEDARKAKKAGASLFVINNRDKDTLEVDLKRSRTLSRGVRGVKIGASGISDARALKYVLQHCDAALIGTAIMIAPDIRKKVEEFVHA